MRRTRRIPIWPIGAGILLCLAWLSFVLPDRTLRWWDLGAKYEKSQWSLDGSQILYLYKEGPSDRRLVIADRNGFWPRLDLHGPILQEPSWRSNTEVSVFSDRGDLNDLVPKLALWLWNLNTGTLQTFDTPLPAVGGIAWSPDGSYALISFRDYEPFTPASMQPGVYRFALHNGQFEIWRGAEYPGAIRWSHDGHYVAYLDLITVGEHKQMQLSIVDMSNNGLSKTVDLNAFTTDNRLAWSPSGKWILLHETYIENPSSPLDYRTLTGFTFVPVDDPERREFWEDSENFQDFDWSPDGNEIIAITVPRPAPGTNNLRVLHVPEGYR